MMETIVKPWPELTAGELYDILQLRSAVFVVEQNCVYQDLDGVDKTAWHVWMRDGDEIVGCLRVYDSDGVHIGRVVSARRRQGIGTALLAEGIRVAREKFNAREILISAQAWAQPFYRCAGFVRYTEPYLEDGIPHVGMRLVF